MQFKDLSVYLDQLEKTSSRIEITKILADLFKKSNKEEIDKIVYLILGSLAPKFNSIVFNIAEKMMIKAVAVAVGREKAEITKSYKEYGDLGNVIEKLTLTQKSETSDQKLDVDDVYEILLDIAKDEGEGSQERKVEKMAELLSQLDPLSAKFVTRIPLGKLRLGFSDKTILDSLSWMEKGDKSAKAELEKAYNVLPDVGQLAKLVKKTGIKNAVVNVSPVCGIPVLPMLAQRIKKPSEMIEKMGEVSVEPKFDGIRVQLHLNKSGFKDSLNLKVKAFTRNLNEISWMFPELGEMKRFVKAERVILDTEAVGVDEARSKLVNFQTTMTRRRKHDIEKISSKVSITFKVFDVLLYNNQVLINESYKKRREILGSLIEKNNLLEVDDFKITKDAGVINDLMRVYLKKGMEGIIVKKVTSTYVSGRTGWRWVKMKEKETSLTKLADTIDCIVMGYYTGRGKRADFGIGGFLVGVREGESIKTFTKIGTGLTDEQFKNLVVNLRKLEINIKPKEYAEVNKTLTPDFWVRPSLVVEITADEITKSPIHSSGYALRFPRLVRLRSDKNSDGASTTTEVKRLFTLQ